MSCTTSTMSSAVTEDKYCSDSSEMKTFVVAQQQWSISFQSAVESEQHTSTSQSLESSLVELESRRDSLRE